MKRKVDAAELAAVKARAAEACAGYETHDGCGADIIRSPGKFEGDCTYVPYFWSVYLDGGADADDGRILTFQVSAAERAVFPSLRGRRAVRLYEDDNGFVSEV